MATSAPYHINDVFKSMTSKEFNALALNIFHFQSQNNDIYAQYLAMLGKSSVNPKSINDIPFIPISLFKSHKVLVGAEYQKIFTSSGTGNKVQSKHHVANLDWYTASYRAGFNEIIGDYKEFTWLCLLPSYLEREGSSLIDMAQGFVDESNDGRSGFYLYNHEDLYQTLKELENENKPTILLGVSFALLDFAEKYHGKFGNLIIMETGGMKGRKKEITRSELHSYLSKSFTNARIMSEYGMTELLSQAYSIEKEEFVAPPWMKAYRRSLSDPFEITHAPGRGALNVVDLANINSCSFIATDDAVEIHSDGKFKIIGRIDNSDIRGCNLMVTG